MKHLFAILLAVTIPAQLMAQAAPPKATGLPVEIHKGYSGPFGPPYKHKSDYRMLIMEKSMREARELYDAIHALPDNPEWLPQLTAREARELWAESLTRKNGMFKTRHSRDALQDRAIEIENAYRVEKAKELSQETRLSDKTD
jgi:hypothetical protein